MYLEHKAAISELLHTDDLSRIDNNDKTPVIVDIGKCPVTGARMYDLHERRELEFDDQGILDKLTGRNPTNKDAPDTPHSTWIEVQKATTTTNRPNGIKGSKKLIRQCKCPCMKKM